MLSARKATTNTDKDSTGTSFSGLGFAVEQCRLGRTSPSQEGSTRTTGCTGVEFTDKRICPNPAPDCKEQVEVCAWRLWVVLLVAHSPKLVPPRP